MTNGPQRQTTFTGRGRARRTTRSVRIADAVARTLITIGGFGTIGAVSLVFVFLVWVVVPLFQGAAVAAGTSADVGRADARPLHFAIDEYRALGWQLAPDGRLGVFDLASGRPIDEQRPFAAHAPTAYSFSATADTVVAGLSDGRILIGSVRIDKTTPAAAELPAELQALPVGGRGRHGNALVEHVADRRFRAQSVRVELGEPLSIGATAAIRHIDSCPLPQGIALAAYTAADELFAVEIGEQMDWETGTMKRSSNGGSLKLGAHERGAPERILLGGNGTSASLIWPDGWLLRIDARDRSALGIAEQTSLLADLPGGRVTALRHLIGDSTLLVGDSAGRVAAWFTAPLDDSRGDSRDSRRLVRGHLLHGPDAPVTALAVSARSRLFAAGHANGDVLLHQATSEKRIATLATAEREPVLAVAIAPKEDGLAALAGGRAWSWQIDPGHPEASVSALFRPIWYEGRPAPEHVWQSSSGTDAFEPKFGMVPLIFGTLKATLFALLFGVPLALLAAIYTSEFLDPRGRARIKPTIELMASLPSVVLGFLAALVFAPFVESRLGSVIACFLTVPFAFIAGGYLWQLLPVRIGLGLSRHRFVFLALTLAIGLAIGWLLGPPFERVFAEDGLKAWLNAEHPAGEAWPGWVVLLMPVAAVGAMLILGSHGARRRHVPSARPALAELGRFGTGILLALALGVGASLLLQAVGLDPRGGIVDTFVQRNALVVGLVMGFAVIPIIYTIAEDALTAVPEHLRAASLGAGATPWQTATRIIVPTAMSGLFSAVMIGLGRAVGETMIVLMAAGGTAILDWNVFNGFLTLSANIATELPEAVQGSTHYRLLFLAGLVLFVMTFTVNTIAELIRQRFRRRAYQL